MGNLRHLQNVFFNKISSHIEIDPQLSIYRNNYFGALSKVLNATYPVCLELIGAEAFGTITTSFIKSTPSTNVSLDLYGKNFPTFLASHPVTNDVEYISDVAKLEQAIHRAFHSENKDDILTLTQLKKMIQYGDCEQISFRLGGSVSIIESQFPIYDIWQYHQIEDTSRLNFNDDAKKAIIYWHDDEVKIEKIDSSTIELLTTITGKGSISRFQEGFLSGMTHIESNKLLRVFENRWVVAYLN